VFVPLATSTTHRPGAFAEYGSPTEYGSAIRDQEPFGATFAECVARLVSTPTADALGPMAALLPAAGSSSDAVLARLAALVGARGAEAVLAMAGVLPFRTQEQQMQQQAKQRQLQWSRESYEAGDEEARETEARLAWGYAPTGPTRHSAQDVTFG
jgi:hypothetical protein